MDDKDAKIQTPSSLRASNTINTLTPRSIFEAVGVPEPEDLAEQLIAFTPKETVYGPVQGRGLPLTDYEYAVAEAKADARLAESDDHCFAYTDMEAPRKSLEDRVTKLEDQMDGLLDRLARYNTKSSHKI